MTIEKIDGYAQTPTRSYRPSNGSEGCDFMASFCDRCERDAAWQADKPGAESCPIIVGTMVAYPGDRDYPPEWVENDVPGLDTKPRCTAFTPIVAAHAGVGILLPGETTTIHDPRQDPLPL